MLALPSVKVVSARYAFIDDFIILLILTFRAVINTFSLTILSVCIMLYFALLFH